MPHANLALHIEQRLNREIYCRMRTGREHNKGFRIPGVDIVLCVLQELFSPWDAGAPKSGQLSKPGPMKPYQCNAIAVLLLSLFHCNIHKSKESSFLLNLCPTIFHSWLGGASGNCVLGKTSNILIVTANFSRVSTRRVHYIEP